MVVTNLFGRFHNVFFFFFLDLWYSFIAILCVLSNSCVNQIGVRHISSKGDVHLLEIRMHQYSTHLFWQNSRYIYLPIWDFWLKKICYAGTFVNNVITIHFVFFLNSCDICTPSILQMKLLISHISPAYWAEQSYYPILL